MRGAADLGGDGGDGGKGGRLGVWREEEGDVGFVELVFDVDGGISFAAGGIALSLVWGWLGVGSS